uniref:Protein root UVB sensitive 3 n=1 Tax=Chenopodium quinoa TaxID=63459 RepID=A0A803MK22_CHEQI
MGGENSNPEQIVVEEWAGPVDLYTDDAFNSSKNCENDCSALLSAIGVGEKSATVIGATFQGSNLDSNAKMWRLVADLLNDLGMLMDLISPLFPSAFVFILCLGSLSRSFTGVASGATRAALTQHFALQNNAADISAKEGSQETVATMAGMVLGMCLAHVTRGHSLAIWKYFDLTADILIYENAFLNTFNYFYNVANYKAVCCLSLKALNGERTSLLLQHFMKTGQVAKVLSAEKVSTEEQVLPLWLNPWSSKKFKCLHSHINLGVKVSSLGHAAMMDLFRSAGSNCKKAKYLLLEKNRIISISLHKDSTPADILQSYIHALVMANLSDKSTSGHVESFSWMDKYYEDFIKKPADYVWQLQSSGWKTERLLLHSVVWRANWFIAQSDEKID